MAAQLTVTGYMIRAATHSQSPFSMYLPRETVSKGHTQSYAEKGHRIMILHFLISAAKTTPTTNLTQYHLSKKKQKQINKQKNTHNVFFKLVVGNVRPGGQNPARHHISTGPSNAFQKLCTTDIEYLLKYFKNTTNILVSW